MRRLASGAAALILAAGPMTACGSDGSAEPAADVRASAGRAAVSVPAASTATPRPHARPQAMPQAMPLPTPPPDAPTAAADPAGLARQLAAAEAVVRDPRSTPEQVDDAAWATQVAYRALGRRPAWDAEVLAGVPAELRTAVRRNVGARRAFAELAPDPLPNTLPAWRIVDPLPAETLRALYLKAERRFGVPWEVLAAVNLVETGMGRIVGLSSAGAKGPMQFMPGTWKAYGMGGDVWDPEDAIMGAANYLRAMGARPSADKAKAERGLRRALYRYNNANAYVRGVLHYASVITADPAVYDAYHAWRVYYRTRYGDVVLETGYEQRKPVRVRPR